MPDNYFCKGMVYLTNNQRKIYNITMKYHFVHIRVTQFRSVDNIKFVQGQVEMDILFSSVLKVVILISSPHVYICLSISVYF